MKYTYCDSLRKNQCVVDKNGNSEVDESLNSNYYNGSTRGTTKEANDDNENVLNPKKQIDPKAINRLQAMAMSDDDDYGEISNTRRFNFSLFVQLHLIPSAL